MAIAVKFKDPVHHIVQKIPVMGHCDHDPGKRIQIILQNGERRDIHIVGRLIQNIHIGSTYEHGEQVQSSLLSAGEFTHRRVLHIRGK